MSVQHIDVTVSRIKEGDTVTIKARRVIHGESREVTNTGKVEGLTEKRMGLYAIHQFTLVEADDVRTNMAGLDSWPITLHTPFWNDFNDQHGGDMRPWSSVDLNMYRTWCEIMVLDGQVIKEMADRYIECLITGESYNSQDREAYYLATA